MTWIDPVKALIWALVPDWQFDGRWLFVAGTVIAYALYELRNSRR